MGGDKVWGQTWGNISLPPGDSKCWVWQVRDLIVDANSHIYAATSSGLWMWDGALWTDYPDLPNTDLTGVAIDSGNLYVATAEGGMYLSEDGGTSWKTLTPSSSRPT
jgi:ligand-binding sensor domain-containing protein